MSGKFRARRRWRSLFDRILLYHAAAPRSNSRTVQRALLWERCAKAAPRFPPEREVLDILHIPSHSAGQSFDICLAIC